MVSRWCKQCPPFVWVPEHQTTPWGGWRWPWGAPRQQGGSGWQALALPEAGTRPVGSGEVTGGISVPGLLPQDLLRDSWGPAISRTISCIAIGPIYALITRKGHLWTDKGPPLAMLGRWGWPACHCQACSSQLTTIWGQGQCPLGAVKALGQVTTFVLGPMSSSPALPSSRGRWPAGTLVTLGRAWG